MRQAVLREAVGKTCQCSLFAPITLFISVQSVWSVCCMSPAYGWAMGKYYATVTRDPLHSTGALYFIVWLRTGDIFDSNAIMQPPLAMAMVLHMLWYVPLSSCDAFRLRQRLYTFNEINEASLSFLLRRNIHYMLVHKWWVRSFASHTIYMCSSLSGWLDSLVHSSYTFTSYRAVTVPLGPPCYPQLPQSNVCKGHCM